MLVLRARWILPIAERPLLNGWCAIDRGRIAAVGRAGAALPFRDDAPLVDLGEMAVLPALTNAHTHLELSWMRGRVPRSGRFTDWVRTMLQTRRDQSPPDDAIVASVEDAVDELRASGTGIRRRRKQHAGHGCAAPPECPRWRRVPRAAATGRGRRRCGARTGPRSSEALRRILARAGQPGAARAILGVAAPVSGHPRGAGTHAVFAVDRPPRRIRGGGRAARDWRGPMARPPAGPRRLGSVMDGAAHRPRRPISTR